MSLFRGEVFHTIDAKGRIILPAKFRDALSGQFIITKGLDKCLFVFPMEEWKLLEEKAETTPLSNIDARKFNRFFFGGATECECDEQGRIVIPPSLRQYAVLQKDIVTVGVVRRVEIWSREGYENYFGDDTLDENISEKMTTFGI